MPGLKMIHDLKYFGVGAYCVLRHLVLSSLEALERLSGGRRRATAPLLADQLVCLLRSLELREGSDCLLDDLGVEPELHLALVAFLHLSAGADLCL